MSIFQFNKHLLNTSWVITFSRENWNLFQAMWVVLYIWIILELWEDVLCLGCSIFQERLEQLVQFIVTYTALDWAAKFFESSLRLEGFFFFSSISHTFRSDEFCGLFLFFQVYFIKYWIFYPGLILYCSRNHKKIYVWPLRYYRYCECGWAA